MESLPLGERIKLLRQERNMPQKELAHITHISAATLSQYENGKRTPPDAWKVEISRIFNVSLDWLIGVSPVRARLTARSPRCIPVPVLQELDPRAPLSMMLSTAETHLFVPLDQVQEGEFFFLPVPMEFLKTSMISGAIALIRVQQAARPLDLVLARPSDSPAVFGQMLRQEGGSLTFVPWGDAHSVYASDTVSILGRVVKILLDPPKAD
ncbi:helix-turn-helix domain-containing protein [Gehongia tenuis]|jgi:transcriptional regulator with XRE-family HTH domain|uniref:Helix-turn-helix domain-containing protein n=1 Tax=Gehongia tenuis TaxID=2763655 RepID=A0A926D2M1_9FIRM|nr:helix-turn-helix transcriptional regulator [Gehongia tenuis]MBC8530371.1 helix-turn-helix domain-containing protein [Gehongia tenuis]